MVKMQKCPNCGKDVRNEGKYCDQCHSFLKLKNPQIQLKRTHLRKIDCLKNTLIESSNLINENNNRISANSEIEYYFETIWSYLLETTNIKSVMDNKKISKDIFFPSLTSLNEVKGCQKYEILDEYIFFLNKKLEETKNNEEIKFNFIFYTNISSNFRKNDKFLKILKFFDLSLFSFEEFKFNENEVYYKSDFKSSFLLLKYESIGKYGDLMEEDAKKHIYLLFGYLTFIQKFDKNNHKWLLNTFNAEYNLSDLEVSCFVILNEDNKFNDFRTSQHMLYSSKNLNESKILDFERINVVYDYYEDLKKLDKSKILNVLNQFFIMYYLAGEKKDLEISFFKFWSLNEKIIKKFYGSLSDDKLVHVMGKILKIYGYYDYLIDRIPFIKGKRNLLVHEGISNINQIDRNITKLITDNLIRFLMENMKYVNNMNEYKFIFDNYNKDNNRNIELLNEFDQKNFHLIK